MSETKSQCRHIFTEGRRCANPALRGQNFCYFHHGTRTSAARPRSRKSCFDLPLPEDRASIQLSLGAILQRIASNQLDPRRAGLLLYGLQIASLNLPREPHNQRPSESVSEVIHDPILGPLAPPADYYTPGLGDDIVEAMIAKLDRGNDPEPPIQQPDAPNSQASEEPATPQTETPIPQPTTLPHLDAASNPTPNPNLLRILRNNRRGGGPTNKRYVLQSASKPASCATPQRNRRDEHRSSTRLRSLDSASGPAVHPQPHAPQQHLRHRR